MKPEAIIASDIRVVQAGRTILDGISFRLNAGEHLAITGNSGSGKTALARVLAGMLFSQGKIEYQQADSSKSIRIAYMPPSETWKNNSNVSDFYYQQRFNSCDAEDVETVDASLRKQPVTETAINYWLEQFGLDHRRQSPLIQLSNGEQKKLQLIRHLLVQPDILIIDQAFTGLDTGSRHTLLDVLESISAVTTLIIITDHHILPSFITHIAELQEGRLHQWATKENYIPQTNSPHNFATQFLPLTVHAQSNEIVIDMQQVTIKYGEKKLLDNINWTVRDGEGWLIRGHNGAGKSTLLSLITADNPQAYSQNISLFGRRRGSGESIWDIKKQIGFVSPELHKYFDTGITVYQAIGSGFYDVMGLYKALDKAQNDAVMRWMLVLGLEEKANQPLSSLPAGQQRWVLIARAMVKQPKVLALDEPCQGLDAIQSQRFLSLVTKLHAATNVTLLYISHYATEVPASVNNILELENGKIKAITSPQQQQAIIQQ
ncbi:ATP-binding cassette domain-containing protein [Nostoc ellipsosporum NOK]|nr:ATP-binding cassette domain-containing protein [Nostoc ellipsosporum NOK]